MKIKILIGILVFLILLNLATLGTYLYYQLSRPEPELPFATRHPGMVRPGMPLLQLDPEQHRIMDEVRQQLRREIHPLMNQIHQLREETFLLMQQDPVSMPEIEENLQQIAALRLEIEKKTLETLINVKASLSPRQQEMLFRFLMDSAENPPMRRGPRMKFQPNKQTP